MNTNARQHYIRTAQSVKSLAEQRSRAILSTGNKFFNYSNGKYSNVSTHMNYIAPKDSSLHIQKLKSNAIGKSGLKVGLPANSPYTTKNYYPSGIRSSVRRARSGGCVAPAKKGSIYNTSSTNGRICGWGSLPRQNY
jgi:hypothetical protein